MIFADAELTGWPLALVICVAIICMVKLYTGDWPWQR